MGGRQRRGKSHIPHIPNSHCFFVEFLITLLLTKKQNKRWEASLPPSFHGPKRHSRRNAIWTVKEVQRLGQAPDSAWRARAAAPSMNSSRSARLGECV